MENLGTLGRVPDRSCSIILPHIALYNHYITHTPRKINMEPENDGLEDDFPFPGVYSQVPYYMLVYILL